MTLEDRIPTLTDSELSSLHANAKRIAEEDGAKQEEAANLLPALEAELSSRKATKAEARKAALAKPRAAKAAAKTATKAASKSAKVASKAKAQV
jgi:hypothetical protein